MGVKGLSHISKRIQEIVQSIYIPIRWGGPAHPAVSPRIYLAWRHVYLISHSDVCLNKLT